MRKECYTCNQMSLSRNAKKEFSLKADSNRSSDFKSLTSLSQKSYYFVIPSLALLFPSLYTFQLIPYPFTTSKHSFQTLCLMSIYCDYLIFLTFADVIVLVTCIFSDLRIYFSLEIVQYPKFIYFENITNEILFSFLFLFQNANGMTFYDKTWLKLL